MSGSDQVRVSVTTPSSADPGPCCPGGQHRLEPAQDGGRAPADLRLHSQAPRPAPHIELGERNIPISAGEVFYALTSPEATRIKYH